MKTLKTKLMGVDIQSSRSQKSPMALGYNPSGILALRASHPRLRTQQLTALRAVALGWEHEWPWPTVGRQLAFECHLVLELELDRRQRLPPGQSSLLST